MIGSRSSRAPRTTRPRPVRTTQKLSILSLDQAGSGGFSAMNHDIVDTSAKSRRKFDLPTPLISNVESYEKDNKPDFHRPAALIRFDYDEAQNALDKVQYTIDEEDEKWLNSKTVKGKKSVLTVEIFEKMIILMEHAIYEKGGTGAEPAHDQSLFTKVHAQELFFSELHWVGEESKKIIADFRAYWLAKRAKQRKPLLRRYWPQTAVTDTNPHMVFRAREEERYKLRRTRRNDNDAFERMKQLRVDLNFAKRTLALVKEREELKKYCALYHGEIYLQRLHELACPSDVTGKKRRFNLKLRPRKKKKKKKKKKTISESEVMLQFKLAEEAKKKNEADIEAAAKKAAKEKEEAEAAAKLPLLPNFMYPTFAPEVYEGMPCATFPDIPQYPPLHHDENRNSIQDGNGEGGKKEKERLPKYVCRARVARGNRVVIDRLPRKRFATLAGLGQNADSRHQRRARARLLLKRQREVEEAEEVFDMSNNDDDGTNALEASDEEEELSALGIKKNDFLRTKCVFAVGKKALGGRGLWGWGGNNSSLSTQTRYSGRSGEQEEEHEWWNHLGVGPMPDYEYEKEQLKLEQLQLQSYHKKKKKGRKTLLSKALTQPYDCPKDEIYEPVYARPIHRVSLMTSQGSSMTNTSDEKSSTKRIQAVSIRNLNAVVNKSALNRIYMLSDSEDDAVGEAYSMQGPRTKFIFSFRI
eukprot:g3273.t1